MYTEIDARSNLDSLLSSFNRIGTVDSMPVFQISLLGNKRNYSGTANFMQQIVALGEEAGVELFVSGDPVIRQFYNAAKSGLAIEMLLERPSDADPARWEQRVMGTESAQSVIERKRLVHAILTAHALDLSQENPGLNLQLLSIASGYGRLPLDVMNDIREKVNHSGQINGFFVDSDQQAVAASQKLAEQKGLGKQVEMVCAPFLRLRNSDLRFHLIESTGLTDYLENNTVYHLFRLCRRLVLKNGIVVVTNITSHKEEEYLDIVWGKMQRRTPEELAHIAISQGFDPNKTNLILDSTETMCTVVTRP